MQFSQNISLCSKVCKLLVDYSANPGSDLSGFSSLIYLPFDKDLCVGYPMMHAKVEMDSLCGYERFCGWIQYIIRTDNYKTESVTEVSLDVSEEFADHQLPYFAFGYPAEIFDAPCRNMTPEMISQKWTAHTYLVEMPNYYVNKNQLKVIAGFSWGYFEDSNHQITLEDFRILDTASYEKDLGLARK